jgi:hypothetical protein
VGGSRAARPCGSARGRDRVRAIIRQGYEAVELIRPEEKRITVVLRPEARTADLLDALEQEQARIERFQIEDEPDRGIVTVTLDSPSGTLLAQLADLEFVQGVEWAR